MTVVYPDEVRALASRYIWWQSPDEALAFPRRLIAQVMDIGGFEDFLVLEKNFGVEAMREAVLHAEPGWFRPRSWHFWHYRLDLTPPGAEPPPLPVRTYDE
jgi:hypothetical protein